MAQDSRRGGFDRSWKRLQAFTGKLRDDGQIRDSVRDVLLALVQIAERNRARDGPAGIVSVSAPQLKIHTVYKMHERTIRRVLAELDGLGLIQYQPGDGRSPSWIDLRPFLEAGFAYEALGTPYLRNHKVREDAHAPQEWNELDEPDPAPAPAQGNGAVPPDLATDAAFTKKLNHLADTDRTELPAKRAQAALRARRAGQWEQCRRLGQEALLACDSETTELLSCLYPTSAP